MTLFQSVLRKESPPRTMSDEQTPLLTTVRVGPPRRRYPHNVARRFCTIALSSILIWGLIAFIITLFVSPQPHQRHDHDRGRPWKWSWPGCGERRLSYEELTQILIETPSAAKSEEWSRYYTAGAHLAGQNYSQVVWTKEKWEEFGVKSSIVAYDTLLNRPVDHRLALLKKSKGKGKVAAETYSVTYEASLKEDVLEEDPTTSLPQSVPTFHGYSSSGNVTAPFVYVNYGTYQDYEDLVKANVSLKGKIAIARYGGIFRGLKVKRAQDLGMVGTVLFTDPGDDGDNTEKNGVEKYPDGPARQPSSVQRGSTQFLSFGPGDPTTPGYPSKPGVPRGDTDKFIPSIPSLPISYQDAIPILKALNGHGPKAADFNKFWKANNGLDYRGVEYNIGPSPDDVVLNLYNEQDYSITPMWNVIGVINGSISDEVIVVGNHRDAWIAGGAEDPNSGSAAINEVIRSFGVALKQGWKPLRTIVFASWDGEEYGLVGSTEWVEEYLPWLSKTAVAYLNIDGSGSGPQFGASAAPLLNELLYNVTAQVQSPNQTVKGQTVRDVWDGRISTMGSGSDFTAFQDFAGIPSLNIGFTGGKSAPVYHYHSNYDSFYWMAKFGDPGFKYAKTVAQVLALLTAKLADLPVVSFRAAVYASSLSSYVDKVEDKLEAALNGQTVKQASRVDGPDPSAEEINELRAVQRAAVPVDAAADFDRQLDISSFKKALKGLKSSISELADATEELDTRALDLEEQAKAGLPWYRWPAKVKLGWEIRKVNTRYKNLERYFLYDGGLDGREWFKHVVFAPGLWTGYAGGKQIRQLE
jgi:N-acetylated-alpha-linked acidic dipeptidase